MDPISATELPWDPGHVTQCPHCAMPCQRQHGKAEGAGGSSKTVQEQHAAPPCPDRGPPPQTADALCGLTLARTSLLGCFSTRAGLESAPACCRCLAGVRGREARRFQPPGRHAATATSLPSRPQATGQGLQRPCTRLQGHGEHRERETSSGDHVLLLAGLVPELSEELLHCRVTGTVPAACRGWQRGARAAAGSIGPAGSSTAFPLAAWHGINPGATSELLF